MTKLANLRAEYPDARVMVAMDTSLQRDDVVHRTVTLEGNRSGLRLLARMLNHVADTMEEPRPYSISISPIDLEWLETRDADALDLRCDPT